MTNNKCAFPVVGLAVAGLLLAACENTPDLRPSSTTPKGSAADQASLTRFSDIPVPAGAKMDVAGSLILGPVDGWVGRLVFKSSTGSQTLFQFYSREMPRFDWQEIARIRAEVSILTYIRGTRTATVQISSTTLGGATVSITMAPSTRSQVPAEPSPGGDRGDSVQTAPLAPTRVR